MLTEKEFKKFSKGDTLDRLDCSNYVIDVYDTVEKAVEALKAFKCSYQKNSVNGLYYVKEYGLIDYGYVDQDGCGTCDVYLAEEENSIKKGVELS